MVHTSRNQKNSPSYSDTKGIRKTIALVFISFLFLIQCTSKTLNPDGTYNLNSDEGKLIQITTKGDNFHPHVKDSFIYFTRKLNSEFPNHQILEKDLNQNLERRITFNLGDNSHPQVFKDKIIYSSSRDEKIESLPVQKLMKEYGLQESPLMENEVGHELYISDLNGSKTQRLTKNKGFDGHPLFSQDGKNIYFLRHNNSTYQILSLQLANQTLKVLHSQTQPIVDFDLSSKYLAIVTLLEDSQHELKIFDISKTKKMAFEYKFSLDIKSIKLHSSEEKILYSGNLKSDQNLDIFEMNWVQKCKVQLTKNSLQDTSPVYGPDYKTFYFSSNRSGAFHIYKAEFPTNPTCSPF